MDMKHGVLADRVGISKAALSLLINNKTLPSFDTSYKICNILNMNLTEIWTAKDPELK